ncbi:acetyltransferase component of pyruvate dehydrogenase complex [Terrihabitans soli]|uniref:Acetyltransferase component of pyruvate dehydrogenase complex n=1 Tax=Terrihabitans soli TaxID=708113 RepID=A0A6S6QUU7_9HYPH|nr:pyruvate dehydrogenase complex dihydrolipoamide acetyltransferase [Terrihabitans soli]BCJ91032.1 acetyltransferase component of pyruvate dehydrogenase complex [Terrihabitans soli]
MPINILMPALSPTMEQGNLVKWLKKEGDKVKSGDVIAEIETDKATMEVEAVDEGTLGKILVPEGTNDVAVNRPIAVLLEEGEDASAASAPAAAPKTEAKAEAPKAEVLKAAEAPKPAPAAATAPAAAPAPAPKANGAARVFASPLARRIAKDRGVDLGAISGSGPHGRIVKKDVETAQPGAARQAPAGAGGLPLMPDDQIRALFEPGSYDVVPHDGMRRVIATRMQQSMIVVPHFFLAVDMDVGPLLRMREEMNSFAPKEDGKPVWRVSVNDLVVKAFALTLKKHPQGNASWTETGMLRHHNVDIGIAVAIPGGGLITPILRNAQDKSLQELSKESSSLAKRAREKKLKPHEYQGGTTAISNLGMYGVTNFTAIVNPPHSTILAVAASEKRAVVIDDKIEIRTIMTATLSCDHRVLDGADAAEIMQTLKGYIEKPVGLVI